MGPSYVFFYILTSTLAEIFSYANTSAATVCLIQATTNTGLAVTLFFPYGNSHTNALSFFLFIPIIYKNPSLCQAQMEGFEPSGQLLPANSLAGSRFQPLSHICLMERSGLEPPESEDTRFTVWPAANYGIPLLVLYTVILTKKGMQICLILIIFLFFKNGLKPNFPRIILKNKFCQSKPYFYRIKFLDTVIRLTGGPLQ